MKVTYVSGSRRDQRCGLLLLGRGLRNRARAVPAALTTRRPPFCLNNKIHTGVIINETPKLAVCLCVFQNISQT